MTNSINGSAGGHTNGSTNGHTNGSTNGHTNGSSNGTNHHTDGTSNGANGHVSTNGHTNVDLDGVSGTPVAICGMAMRLPGGIRNERELYDFLFNKGDARTVVPEDRYNTEG
jgi:hypothetical protein